MEKEQKDKKLQFENKDLNFQKPQELNTIFGLFRSSTTAPTGRPVKFGDQIVIDTTTSRLYIYDTASKTWKYSALT